MLGWRPLLLSWLNTLPKTLKEDNKELIRDLFDRMETALLQFIRKGGFKVNDSWRRNSLCSLLSSCSTLSKVFSIFYRNYLQQTTPIWSTLT